MDFRWKNDQGLFTGIATLDGYSFGDRILEGVTFYVTINEGLVVDVRESKDSKNYLDSIGREHWLGRAKEHAEDSSVSLYVREGEYELQPDNVSSPSDIRAIPKKIMMANPFSNLG